MHNCAIVQNHGAVNSANFVNYVKKSDHLKCTPATNIFLYFNNYLYF
jgi:hypothetical protein